MSILSALKQQTSSIDDLAKLPQAMIMQMAQKGDIRQDMIAPILARKAELTQAVANTRAMQNQQVKPTVMEQIMSQNAMAEAPASGREIGLPQLPMREDMFAPQRMAGGGIVAFADNQDQPVSEDMPTTLSDSDREFLEKNPYLRRSRAIAELGQGIKEAFTNPSNYNPISLYQRNIGQPFAEAVNRFTSESPEKQAERFRMGQQARTGEIPMFAGTDLTTKGKMVAEGRMKPNENVIDVLNRERQQKLATAKELEDFDKAAALFQAEQGAKTAGKRGNVSTQQAGAKTKVEPQVKQEEEPLYSKYEKMLMDEREAAKGAREEAKWSRMLEAGLGILGGTSQYAFENIGKGATPALKGYGEDIKGLRTEERGRVKELLGIEEKRQEAKRAAEDLGLKKQMLEVQRLAATKPDSTAQIIGLGKSAGLGDREILSLLAGSKDPNTSAATIAMKAFFDSPVLQAKYNNDVNAFLRAQGIGAGAGGQTVLNYIPGQGLKS